MSEARTYADSLEAHIASGGKAHDGNVRDLIQFVKQLTAIPSAQLTASLAADTGAVRSHGKTFTAQEVSTQNERRRIDSDAWRLAVQSEFGGRPLWVLLADGVVDTEAARHLLGKYLAIVGERQ